MAKGGKFTVYVTKQINFSTLTIRGTGQYGPLPLSGLSLYVPKRALYTTTSTGAFWRAVLTDVQAQIATLP